MNENVMASFGPRQTITERFRERDSFGKPQIFRSGQCFGQQFLLIDEDSWNRASASWKVLDPEQMGCQRGVSEGLVETFVGCDQSGLELQCQRQVQAIVQVLMQLISEVQRRSN